MDTVELPLPVNVVVSKLLVAEGFTRIMADENKARGVSILGNHSSVSCSSSQGVHPSERNTVSKTEKKTDVQFDMHTTLLPNFDDDSNGQHLFRENNNSILMLPEYSGKQLRRKAMKVPTSSSPCVKRPRTDQLGDSMNLVGHADNSVMCGKIVLNTARCNSAEKARVVKQKHGQDGKRGDKRNFRTVAKTKFDPLMSSNLTNGGNNILGIYGLKSDIHDVTKHMGEFSLKDLIDGSYKSPITIQDSGMKSTSNNENFMLSIRKACSILPLYSANHSRAADSVDGSCDKKSAACRPSASPYVANKKECHDKDKVVAEISLSCKDFLGNLGPLENPKDIQGRLTLPSVNDLNSFISHIPVPALPNLQRLTDLHSGTPILQNASLPPFPWSLSPSGPCKANLDSGKLSANRSICQQRWIRIGSDASSLGTAHSRFSEQDLRPDHNSFPLSELKFDGLPVFKRTSLQVSSCTAIFPPASQVVNKTIFKNGHVVTSSHLPPEPSFSDGHLESPDKCYLKNGSKEHLPFVSLGTQDSITLQGKEEVRVGLSQNCLLVKPNETAAVEAENSMATTDHHTDSNCYIPSKLSFDGCDQHSQHLHLAENSKHGNLLVGHSPRLLAAAQTLCEIASYWSNGRGKQSQDNSKLRWPRKPSQKTMKAPRPRTSTGKTVEGFAASEKLGDPIKSIGSLLSSKPKILMTDKKKNLIHINNGDRGPVKWLPSGKYPPKLGGDPVAHTNHLNPADSVKLPGRMVLSIREDRICNSRPQKLRKAAMTNISAGNGAKDLVTRNKKE